MVHLEVCCCPSAWRGRHHLTGGRLHWCALLCPTENITTPRLADSDRTPVLIAAIQSGTTSNTPATAGQPASTAIVASDTVTSSSSQVIGASPVNSESTSAVDNDKDDGSGLATGSLVGIICGTILLIVLVLAACWLYRKYLKQVRVRQVAELAKLQRRGDPHPVMTQTGAGTMTYPSGFNMSIASTTASDTYFIRQSPRHNKFKEVRLPALPESMILPEHDSAGKAYYGDTSTDSSSTPYNPSTGTSLGLSYLGSYKNDQPSS